MATVSCIRARILTLKDRTDAREIVEGSGSFVGVRGILIGFEDVAAAPRCAVDAVEEDDVLVLFCASDETVSNRGLDWAVELAWVMGSCWVAEVHGGKPGKSSLSSLFYLFSVLFSELNLLFEFKFEFCFVL
jgi:hypothetical protein